jgi:hypothetical protein
MKMKTTLKALPGIIILYLILLIADKPEVGLMKTSSEPFLWNRDATWEALENQFIQSRGLEKTILDIKSDSLKSLAEHYLTLLASKNFQPTDSLLTLLQSNFFNLASYVAAQQQSDWLSDYYSRTRNLLKKQSQSWDIHNRKTRNALYSILYGMRAANEEVLLQLDADSFSPVMYVKDEPSVTPQTNILGIRVHSGDLLVSRGGAEVSALISRGNDYPGNFSHVALIYIDEKSNVPYLIEAHIERGVAISSVDSYLKDTKLRFMVLRPRFDLLLLKKDPMVPQKAAHYAYNEARSRHIPYDFKMDFYDPSKMFCSEVASYAYKKQGLQLWLAESTISSQGVINWLNTFGVENFVTQMPSDLEYDPQLAVVAEWRDTETLLKDHVDNVVMDAMLEFANDGYEIDYAQWKLPFVRILKFYNMMQNLFGIHGMIPEGMSATRALKNNTFVDAHVTIKADTEKKVREFITNEGYIPPYWKLFSMASEAANTYYSN